MWPLHCTPENARERGLREIRSSSSSPSPSTSRFPLLPSKTFFLFLLFSFFNEAFVIFILNFSFHEVREAHFSLSQFLACFIFLLILILVFLLFLFIPFREISFIIVSIFILLLLF
ncbi:hypothetical protein H920_06232 [Fukomys damarensis]|uniref:Uncharacterized protein n=1 Tax=Fukomys damarensis TaxID=885580 RepID=A0A091DMR3_FUKDA|nr:hypothetical protein H920_06232 [Fukomys damarensis]